MCREPQTGHGVGAILGALMDIGKEGMCGAEELEAILSATKVGPARLWVK